MRGLPTVVATFIVLTLLSASCLLRNKPVKQEIVSVPAGWYLSWHNSGVGLTRAEEKKIAYSIFFDRSIGNEEEAYYIKVAEAVYPEKTKIPNRSKLTTWYFERLWWFEEYKDFRIPFALTGDTVNYFIKKYKELKKSLQQETDDDSGQPNRIEFAYSAKAIGVNKDGSSTGPVRVLLKMRFFEYCGEPCGWGFEKTREVFFDSKTRISRITGDGTVKKWVSEKKKPFQDDQWITF